MRRESLEKCRQLNVWFYFAKRVDVRLSKHLRYIALYLVIYISFITLLLLYWKVWICGIFVEFTNARMYLRCKIQDGGAHVRAACINEVKRTNIYCDADAAALTDVIVDSFTYENTNDLDYDESSLEEETDERDADSTAMAGPSVCHSDSMLCISRLYDVYIETL